ISCTGVPPVLTDDTLSSRANGGGPGNDSFSYFRDFQLADSPNGWAVTLFERNTGILDAMGFGGVGFWFTSVSVDGLSSIGVRAASTLIPSLRLAAPHNIPTGTPIMTTKIIGLVLVGLLLTATASHAESFQWLGPWTFVCLPGSDRFSITTIVSSDTLSFPGC